jgi:hypothetical protein
MFVKAEVLAWEAKLLNGRDDDPDPSEGRSV